VSKFVKVQDAARRLATRPLGHRDRPQRCQRPASLTRDEPAVAEMPAGPCQPRRSSGVAARQRPRKSGRHEAQPAPPRYPVWGRRRLVFHTGPSDWSIRRCSPRPSSPIKGVQHFGATPATMPEVDGRAIALDRQPMVTQGEAGAVRAYPRRRTCRQRSHRAALRAWRARPPRRGPTRGSLVQLGRLRSP
jgi:hypothetical protein